MLLANVAPMGLKRILKLNLFYYQNVAPMGLERILKLDLFYCQKDRPDAA